MARSFHNVCMFLFQTQANMNSYNMAKSSSFSLSLLLSSSPLSSLLLLIVVVVILWQHAVFQLFSSYLMKVHLQLRFSLQDLWSSSWEGAVGGIPCIPYVVGTLIDEAVWISSELCWFWSLILWSLDDAIAVFCPWFRHTDTEHRK